MSKDGNPKDLAASSKVPLWLLSAVAKAHWALAQFAGMLKYGAWNWRIKGVRSSIYVSAIQRHLDAYQSGEEFDPVDGTHHLGNIMASCAILLDARAAGKLTDDRPPSVGIRTEYLKIERQAAKLIEQYNDRNPRHYNIDDTEDTLPPEAIRFDADAEYLDSCDYKLDAYEIDCPSTLPSSQIPGAA